MKNRRGYAVPYYQQIANTLRAWILDTEGSPHGRLPSEPELARRYRVARETVRRALAVLEKEGLIERTPRRGTVVVPAGVRAGRRLRKAQVVSVVTSWVSLRELPRSFYGQIYQGILVSTDQKDYRVSTTHMRGAYPDIGPAYRPHDPNRVVGVIIVGVRDERVIGMHAEAGYPVVSVDHWPMHPKVDAVLVDCFEEGQRAAAFLASLGHRVVFYLGNLVGHGPERQPESDAELLEAGFRRGLRACGLELPAEYVHYCRPDAKEVARAVEWFAGLRPRATAGLVCQEQTAEGFLAGLAQHGISCPQDVSLVSKVGGPDSNELTSFRADGFLMGCWAVRLLLERARGNRTETIRVAIGSSFHRGRTTRSVAGQVRAAENF